ncbi:hypothetical protein KIM372_12670 [Bombiscardovia nodaiensis]|uniref:Uncharacterized protein n=1 Tax=Bombiscardovia nodaiensis TaxID=2932181 RepID=A0ABM8B8X5_9BIFI|nr:hypothetical protein KIM372_12670 [Bombiscardovia nodaiensis]
MQVARSPKHHRFDRSRANIEAQTQARAYSASLSESTWSLSRSLLPKTSPQFTRSLLAHHAQPRILPPKGPHWTFDARQVRLSYKNANARPDLIGDESALLSTLRA